MKLIGSKTETEIRERLLLSRSSFADADKKLLLVAYDLHRIDFNRSFVVNWIPEQGEDIYFILTEFDKILELEVPRDGSISRITERGLDEYQKKISKHQRITIAVASELMRSTKEM